MNSMEEGGEKDGFLGARKQSPPETDKQPESSIPFCGCLSVSFYKPYFNVDTKDVWDRLVMSAFYCRKDDRYVYALSRCFSSPPSGSNANPLPLLYPT